MRKIITIVLFLLLGSNLKSQNYVQFPDSNASWEVAYYSDINCPPPSHYCYTIQYFLKGDTTINLIKYSKLYYVYLTQPTLTLYSGAIRQDTLNRKIFYRPNNNSTDLLLQDFNLNIGDTLPLSYTVSNTIWVTGIDTITIGGIPRKVLLLDCANNICDGCYLIEGIGSSNGLLGPVGYFEGGNFLICFNQNDTTIFAPFGNCEIIFNPSIEESNSKKTQITIYPNPAYYSINIVGLTDNIFAEVYDISGKLILTRKLLIPQLDISSLAKGMYFIKLSTKEGSVVRKFIKE